MDVAVLITIFFSFNNINLFRKRRGHRISNKKSPIAQVIDQLYELHEIRTGERLTDKYLAKLINVDKSAMSNIRNEKRILKIEEAEILAKFFDVPLEVISGRMKVSEIPPKDNHGLKELKFLSRKWIYDNSKDEDGIKRVLMLNRILSNPKTADLLFDTLYAYTLGLSVNLGVLHDKYSKKEIEKIILKELVLSNLDEFFIDIYKRMSDIREKQRDEELSRILNKIEKSRKSIKEERELYEREELEYIKQEIQEGKLDMENNNI